MKSTPDSVAFVKKLANKAEVHVPRSEKPLVVSSQITADLVPDGPYAPVLPTDMASLRLLAFAAQLRGRIMISEANDQTEMVDGMSWLRVSALAAFISGTDTDRSKDHLLVASIFHRMGETDLAEGEFLAAHNALTAAGRDSDWDDYGYRSPEDKDELADAATDIQELGGARYRDFSTQEAPEAEPLERVAAEEPSVSTPAETYEQIHRDTESSDGLNDVVQSTVDRGARAFRSLQDKFAELTDGDVDQSQADKFLARFSGSSEAPAAAPAQADEPAIALPVQPLAPQETPARESADINAPGEPLLPSVASILARPFIYPDSLTDNKLRQELVSYPATTAGDMMLTAYEQSQGAQNDPVLGQYFANHEYEAYRRIDDPVGMSHALARLALSRRNAGRGDQQALFQAFETTAEALQLVEGFPAFPDVARPSLPSALLFLDAGQPQQAIQQLTPVISAGEDLLARTGSVDRLLADLYTVRSKAYNDQLATTGSDDDRRRISEDYNRATEIYTMNGQPDGFQKARQRYLI